MRYLATALVIATVLVTALVPLRLAAQSPNATVQSPTAAPPGSVQDGGMFGLDLGSPASSGAQFGGRWVRIIADWSALEPAGGAFAWTNLDTAVKAAADAGGRIVAVIANTPRWAALMPEAPEEVWRRQPPRDLAAWQAFVRAAASRYRGRIAAWQIEPVLDFAVFRGTVQDYLGMLHAARVAVRQADPGALIAAASPPGLDLPYTRLILAQASGDADVLSLFPRDRSPEAVLEALSAIRDRILSDSRPRLWMEGTDADLSLGGLPDAAVGDQMVRMAAVDLAGGVTRQFWSGRELSPTWTPVRETIERMLSGMRFEGWLDRGPGVYALVMAAGQTSVAVVWSTTGPQTVPMESEGELRIINAAGAPLAPATRDGRPAVPADAGPVFVQGLAASVISEAAQTARQGPPRIPPDPAHDFSRAAGVSVALGATNIERGLYNQRFRTRPAGAVIPVVVEDAAAVRTDEVKGAVYVYLDVDHSFAYFIDGRADLLVTVEVHRAGAAQRVGFNLLYDSMTGYRFTPWQWVEAGARWVTYTVRLTDANFSSTWGWDFAVNGAGNRQENLVVKSVTVQKVPPGG